MKTKQKDRSILIIENDPAFAQILFNFAHEKQFSVLTAEDGEEGLFLANHYIPSGIILGLSLPGKLNGLTVLTRLKEDMHTRHIPVHTTSYRDKDLNTLKIGAVGHLTKPDNPEQIETAFNTIEKIISTTKKKLLVIEGQTDSRDSTINLLRGKDISISSASSGQEALFFLNSMQFDCIVLDLQLSDMPGTSLIKKIRENENYSHIPIIIFTEKEPSSEEQLILDNYAERVILKGIKSHERLFDETALFLHRIEAELPKAQQKMLHLLHDKKKIFKGKKLLLVDDDMRNLFALGSVLEEKGLSVTMTPNGKKALEQLREQPDTHLVLMDIMMPDMDGYQTMQEIRKQEKFKKLPIIALTAKAMKGDRIKCIEAGANDYLSKPIDTDKLLSMLRVWLY